MATLQVKSMDDQLYRALSKRAEQENRSISQEVIAIIKEYLSGSTRKNRQATAAFLDLANSWEDKRSAEEIVRDIRKARSTKRFKGDF